MQDASDRIRPLAGRHSGPFRLSRPHPMPCFRFPSLPHFRFPRRLAAVASTGAALLLAACGADIRFPDDADIAKALSADFAQDADNARARELVRTLGGETGALDYRIRQVIWRQGAFEARYEVNLKMGQAGSASLQQLYATMVPKDEAAKLPQQTLPAYEEWLKQHAATLEKSDAQQAAALRASLDNLGKCYRDAKAGDSVALMTGLAALISPARDGWFAERLQSPAVRLHCLPL